MFVLAPISTRNQISFLLNEKGLIGEGVEIGTHRGEYARILLSKWKGKCLHCIDPWYGAGNIPMGYEEQHKTLWGSGNREEDYQACKENLEPYIGRFKLHRKMSMQAVWLFNNESLDFVYIDGDHRYGAVKDDIQSWWKRLKIGGMIAGHDFFCPGEIGNGWGPGIQRAIYELFPFETEIHLILEENNQPSSFMIYKKEV